MALIFSIRQLSKLLVCSAVLGFTLNSLAEEPEMQKTWRFQGAAGAVEVRLTRYINKDGTKPTSLQIYSPDGAPRTVSEEAGFLDKVLDDFPVAGISVQSLGWISFRFNETDAVGKIAVYVASSRRWKESLKTNSAAVIYPLVTSFLTASGAYEDWNRVFRQHGLTLRIVGVEKVFMEPFAKAHTNCPPAINCSHLVVPADALVQMNVIPIPHR